MRSRPDLKVWIHPSPVHPGQNLRVSALLVSMSETPVDAITFSLRGVEHQSEQQDRGVETRSYSHVALDARYPATALAPGEHRYDVVFPIPPTAPPTYQALWASARYELTVRVDIPWWPDRVGTYDIPVRAAPVPTAPRPGLFATATRGASQRELYAECSLDSVYVQPGGVVRGAVSFTNTRDARIVRVRAALVQHLRLPVAHEMVRHEFVVHEGPPPEGEAVRFGLLLPDDLAPSLRVGYVEMHWRLEVAVEAAWKTRTLLDIPVLVLPHGSLGALAVRVMPPAVGRERRRTVWAPAAAAAGLRYDEAEDRIRGAVGDVALSLAVEQRVRDGLFTVATLAWPPLDMALSVGPAQWNDRFSEREVDVGDAAFDARFRVRGRFAEQVRALLSEGVRRHIPDGVEVRVGDRGATVAVPGALSEHDLVRALALGARQLAVAFDAAIVALPPPPPLGPHAAAWRRFAERTRGRWSAGPAAIESLRHGLDRFDLRCTWTDEGACTGTALSLHLDPALPEAPTSEALGAAARELRALRADVVDVSADASVLVCTLRDAVQDPAALEPLLDRMARAARALQGRGEVGPYR